MALITGLNVAKTDPVSVKQFPLGTFEAEAFQVRNCSLIYSGEIKLIFTRCDKVARSLGTTKLLLLLLLLLPV
jgi:hypothetical protein